MRNREHNKWKKETSLSIKVRWATVNIGSCLSDSLAVVVEDSSSSCCVTVKVFPHATIAALKQQVSLTVTILCQQVFQPCFDLFHSQHWSPGCEVFFSLESAHQVWFPLCWPGPQVFLEYGFHPRVQRWVISQCLCTDLRSLASYGVRRDGDTAFLYLLTARHSRLTRHLLQQDQESALLLAPPSNPPPSFSHPHPSSLGSSNSGGGGGGPPQDWRTYSTMPPQLYDNGTGATPTHTQPTEC